MKKLEIIQIKNRNDVEVLLEAASRTSFEPLVFPKILEERTLKSFFISEKRKALDLCFNEDFGIQFQKRCSLLNVPAEAYQNRVFADSNGRLWIVGIRFRNLDVRQPFLSIAGLRINDAPTSTDIQIFEELLFEFRAFDVKRVQFLSFGGGPSSVPPASGLLILDKQLVCGRIQTVSTASPSSDLQLRRPLDDSFLRTYDDIFDELLIDRPELAKILAREDAESFADSLSQNLLFEVLIQGRVAGLVAAEQDPFLGHPGFLVREEILAIWARGRGLGRQLQSALAKELLKTAAPSSLLHGTIHASNLPSLLTAIRSGREVVGSYVFWEQVRS